MSDTPLTDARVEPHDEAYTERTAGYNDLLEWAQELERDLTAALAKLSEVEAERDALKVRLEIDRATDGNGNRVPFPEGAPDGIACRDQTIKLLEERVAALKEDAEQLVAAAWDYMSQIGQGYAAHGLPFGPEQEKADTELRAALDAARKK